MGGGPAAIIAQTFGCFQMDLFQNAQTGVCPDKLNVKSDVSENNKTCYQKRQLGSRKADFWGQPYSIPTRTNLTPG